MSTPILRALVPGAVVALLVSLVAPGCASRAPGASEQFLPVSPEYETVIEDMEAAFNRRDAVAVGAGLTEDFSWWGVSESGPKAMVTGRAATVELLQKFFASPGWIPGESEIHHLGMVGNTKAQVEVDYLNTDKGRVRQTTLHVYQYKDGKLWREFTFYPDGT